MSDDQIKLIEKLEQDLSNGIMDQTTYQRLKKKLDSFSVAESNIHKTTIAAAMMVTQRPQVTQSIIDDMKSNLVLQKLREEIGEDNFNYMKDDFKNLNQLTSSLKNANAVQKIEILNEINKKQEQIDNKIDQLKNSGKLSSQSASKVITDFLQHR